MVKTVETVGELIVFTFTFNTATKRANCFGNVSAQTAAQILQGIAVAEGVQEGIQEAAQANAQVQEKETKEDK